MKKISRKLFTCLLVVVMLIGISACAEVEKGSKIQRMKIELEFLDVQGKVVDTQSATIKLFLNFAPKTTEHFMKLAADGYYDGVTISHVNSTWCEFGAYNYDNGMLAAKEYNYDKLDGEFARNGLTGNKLTSSAGVLIMKREYNTNDGVSQYNSAKASVIMTFNAAAKFKAEEYCIFGTIVTDDADEDYSSSASDSVDRNGLSSYEKISTIKNLSQDENGNKTYFFEQYEKFKSDSRFAGVASDYYSVTFNDDGSARYYKGLGMIAENEITGDDLEDYLELFEEQGNYFLAIPYAQVRIKSITKI